MRRLATGRAAPLLVWWGIACATGTAVAQNESAIAAQILGSSGLRKGVCIHAGCGEGVLTAELGAYDGVVQGLTDDASELTAARTLLIGRGLYGRVSAVAAAADRLPYADNTVNLIVAHQLAALRAKGLTVAEVLRVVAPYGIMYVGGEADETTLRSVLDGAGVSGYEIVNQNGIWARYVKPYPTEMDEWRQFRHDASRQAQSRDQLIGPPNRLRWIAGDGWVEEGRGWSMGNGGIMSGNGRNYYLNSVGDTNGVLSARDAFNGVLLWERAIDNISQYPGGRRRMIVHGDRVITRIGGMFVALDGATGETVQIYSNIGSSTSHLTYAVDSLGRELLIVGQGAGAAYDVATGERVWTRSGGTGAYDPAVVVGNELFSRSYSPQHLQCQNLTTGEVKWRAPIATMSANELVWVKDGIAAFFSPVSGTVDLYSAVDGTPLWSYTHSVNIHGGDNDRPFYLGGYVWVHEAIADGSEFSRWVALNPTTGVEVKRVVLDTTLGRLYHRCYGDRATDKYILYGGMEFMDFVNDTLFGFYGARGICAFGYLPANGLLYNYQTVCLCFAQLRGITAVSAESWPDVAALKAQGVRLETGPAYQSATGAAGADDWPEYRHDGVRSGRTTMSLPTELNIHWQTNLGQKASSVVVADGMVFATAVDEHQVMALDAQSGAILWRYTAGGRVDSPPTYYKGYVLFGGHDGWVYSVRASDGALAWRFRAAPGDRRIVARGQFESAWPVYGSVLVIGDTAYVSAGRHSEIDGGIALYALHAETGAVVWEKMEVRPYLHRRNRHGLIGSTHHGMMTTDVTAQTVYMDFMNYSAATGDAVADPTGRVLWGGPCGFTEDIAKPQHTWKWTRRHWAYTDGSRRFGDPTATGGVGMAVDGSTTITIRHESGYTSENAREVFRSGTSPWSNTVTDTVALMKAVLWAGDRVYVAAHVDPSSQTSGELWIFSAVDGSPEGTVSLGAAPAFDGLAAADNRLYVSTQDGRIMCLTEGAVSISAGQAVPMMPPAIPSDQATHVRRWSADAWQTMEEPPLFATHSSGGEGEQPAVAQTRTQTSQPTGVVHALCAIDARETEGPAAVVDPAGLCDVSADGLDSRCSGTDSTRIQPRLPRDMLWHNDLPCLNVAHAHARTEAGQREASYTHDSDLRTRWRVRAGTERTQWITYDLGQTCEVSGVTVVWYALKSNRTGMAIELSLDGHEFSQVDGGALCGRGTMTTMRSFLPERARFVRVVLDTEGAADGLSLYEVGIHGTVETSTRRLSVTGQ